MSWLGENLLADLLARIIFKSITIARHIANDGRLIRVDQEDMRLRLDVQIARLDAVEKVLRNQKISNDVQPRDRHTFVNVIHKLHKLLLEYVQKTDPNSDKTIKLVRENSANDLFSEIHKRDAKALSNPSQAQEKFWLRAKEIVAWSVFKKKDLEKLVAGVEAWGNCLDVLISSILPLIFIRQQLSAAEIAENTPGGELGDVHTMGQILMERRLDEEAAGPSSMTGVQFTNREAQSAVLDYSRLRFLSPPSPQTKRVRGSEQKDDGRTDLGGASRRQWAELLDSNGKIEEQRIIVEFKERPPTRETLSDKENLESIEKQLRSLVRELRLASQRAATFQVLYCHGYYERPDAYGLVYQLPKSITVDTYLECQSLGNILMNADYKKLLAENLENRLNIAKSLATTMYHLHSVQWVHKTFNPDNVLLFGRKSVYNTVDFDWNHPYLVGFDASRANHAHSDRLPPSLRWENRVYTHPARQREGDWARFHKIFDIYSVGVVLLEIGILECFKDSSYRRDPKWTDIPATEVLKRFVAKSKELKSVLGLTYAEIVETCLTGEFGICCEKDDKDETHLLEAFRSEVCEKFDQIHY